MSKSQPRALLFDPSLSTLGGGERYLFSLAECLSAKYDVTIAGPDHIPVDRLKKLGFADKFKVIRLSPAIFTETTANFECVVYLAIDFPLPSNAGRSFAVVQFPFTKWAKLWRPKTRAAQKAALGDYEYIVYSKYVATWLKKRWGVKSEILAPMVNRGHYEPQKKNNTILAVGRFFVGGHNKRQDALIDAYMEMPKNIRDAWKLVLAGGITDKGLDQEHLQSLKRRAISEPNIIFKTNITPHELASLYGQAKLFWHATGYGRVNNQPEKAEHFGMTTIEAMSYGCVPLVYSDGGQKEIVKENFGLLWTGLDQLVKLSSSLMNSPERLQKMANTAVEASKLYDAENFRARCFELFNVEDSNT